jgi:hypothetical protein
MSSVKPVKIPQTPHWSARLLRTTTPRENALGLSNPSPATRMPARVVLGLPEPMSVKPWTVTYEAFSMLIPSLVTGLCALIVAPLCAENVIGFTAVPEWRMSKPV